MPSAKSAVSALWWLRVDGDADVLRPKVKAFAERLDCVSLIAVHHKGDNKTNPHIHTCIAMNFAIQKQSFAIQVKKHFEVVDRAYALDVWDGNREKGAPTYLFHEMGVIFISKGWSNDEITSAQHLGYEIAEEVQKSKQKASQKLVERTLVQYKDRQIPSRFDILLFMVKEIQAGTAYHPGLFKLKQYVEEVEIKLSTSATIYQLTNEFYSNMWRV